MSNYQEAVNNNHCLIINHELRVTGGEDTDSGYEVENESD